MAGNKTEAPTPKRLLDAKKKGQIAKSADLIGAICLFCIVISGAIHVNQTLILFKTWLVRAASHAGRVGQEPIENLIVDLIRDFILCSIGLLALVFCITAIGLFLMIGAAFKPIEINSKNLNLIDGLKSLFSKKKGIELLKICLKLVSGMICSLWIIKEWLSATLDTSGSSRYLLSQFSVTLIYQIGFTFGCVFLLIGIIDYFHQRYQLKKDLMMSLDEIREEYKEMEGDPIIKSMRKGLQRQLAGESIQKKLSKARVVIANPTQIAVALEYDESEHNAPKILIKGVEKSASFIRKEAIRNGIPIIYDKKLARLLFRIPNGEEIPDILYEVVADIFLGLIE